MIILTLGGDTQISRDLLVEAFVYCSPDDWTPPLLPYSIHLPPGGDDGPVVQCPQVTQLNRNFLSDLKCEMVSGQD